MSTKNQNIQRISKYERVVMVPTTAILIKLANALEVSLDAFIKKSKFEMLAHN